MPIIYSKIVELSGSHYTKAVTVGSWCKTVLVKMTFISVYIHVNEKTTNHNAPKEKRWRLAHLPITKVNLNNAYKTRRKVPSHSNLDCTISLAQGQILQKRGFPCIFLSLYGLCKAWRVWLVVKYTATIVFPTEDWKGLRLHQTSSWKRGQCFFALSRNETVINLVIKNNLSLK